jgi:hypothetical protein
MLAEGATLDRCEPVTWEMPVEGSEPQIPGTRRLGEKVQDVMPGARQKQNEEARQLE